MKQAHNIVTFSVFRDGLVISAPQANVAKTTSIATQMEERSEGDLQINVSGDAHDGGDENISGMGILPLLLGEQSSKDLDKENDIEGEEHKSPQQKSPQHNKSPQHKTPQQRNAEVPDEMSVENSKKYMCAKSGCGYITNSIKDMVSHKNNCIASLGYGQLQPDNSEMPEMIAGTENGHEPEPNLDIMDNVEPAVSREDESEKSSRGKHFPAGEDESKEENMENLVVHQV